jgi:NAD(P)-dependent dehydrogenase (short-subunit alcohol dehydrogenase family)
MSKVWLMTGSSRGLGRAFTEAVLAAGHSVLAAARNPDQVADLQSRYGDKIHAVSLDVTSEAQAKNAVDRAIATFGRLDVLVNNAGYGNVCPVEDTALDDFRAQIETNLFGVVIMTKAVLPYFRERKAGHIIQITSIAGRVGPAGRAPYAAAKFGVEGFSESLSKEIGPLGVKVTIVEPGGFRTDFAGSSAEFHQGRPEYESTVGAAIKFQRNYNGKQPGDPAKAAEVLLHIASLLDPPLRLLLGSESYAAAEKSSIEKLESDRQWKNLSLNRLPCLTEIKTRAGNASQPSSYLRRLSGQLSLARGGPSPYARESSSGRLSIACLKARSIASAAMSSP